MTDRFVVPEPSAEAHAKAATIINDTVDSLGGFDAGGDALRAAYAIDLPALCRAEVERALDAAGKQFEAMLAEYVEDDDHGITFNGTWRNTYLASRFPEAAPEPEVRPGSPCPGECPTCQPPAAPDCGCPNTVVNGERVHFLGCHKCLTPSAGERKAEMRVRWMPKDKGNLFGCIDGVPVYRVSHNECGYEWGVFEAGGTGSPLHPDLFSLVAALDWAERHAGSQPVVPIPSAGETKPGRQWGDRPTCGALGCGLILNHNGPHRSAGARPDAADDFVPNPGHITPAEREFVRALADFALLPKGTEEEFDRHLVPLAAAARKLMNPKDSE